MRARGLLALVRRPVVAVATLVICVLVLAERLPAQSLFGSLSGTVFDAQGGVLPGATITLTDQASRTVHTTVTNEQGVFVFAALQAATYTLKVEMQGFRSFVQENIRVQTRSDMTVDAKLEVGQLSETIRVEESPVAVQFNKTTMETTLDTKMSNSLPIIHRNPFLLLQLDPQVTFTSTSAKQSPFHHWAGSRLDVGGGTQLKNDILVDGTKSSSLRKKDPLAIPRYRWSPHECAVHWL